MAPKLWINPATKKARTVAYRKGRVFGGDWEDFEGAVAEYNDQVLGLRHAMVRRPRNLFSPLTIRFAMRLVGRFYMPGWQTLALAALCVLRIPSSAY